MKTIEAIREELLNIKQGSPKYIVGLTGGIASGKSTVSLILKRRGAAVIDFDLLSRQVTQPGKPGFTEIVNNFGREVLNEEGFIDRKYLSRIVFKDPYKKRILEQIIHPKVFQEYVLILKESLRSNKFPLIVADVPLLIEASLMDFFHYVLLIYVHQDIQIRRIIARDGITHDHARSIVDSQMPSDEKIKFAHIVIVNDKGIDELERCVDIVWYLLINKKTLPTRPYILP